MSRGLEVPIPPSTLPRSMRDRYDLLKKTFLEAYGIRVHRWRSSMSGMAWEVQYEDGTISRLIESPKPVGPVSVSIFCHEVGHHAIGFMTYTPRCLEEYKAWEWSLTAMHAWRLNITDAVHLRIHESLWYAADKARRRGIKRMPEELLPFLQRPARHR